MLLKDQILLPPVFLSTGPQQANNEPTSVKNLKNCLAEVRPNLTQVSLEQRTPMADHRFAI